MAPLTVEAGETLSIIEMVIVAANAPLANAQGSELGRCRTMSFT